MGRAGGSTPGFDVCGVGRHFVGWHSNPITTLTTSPNGNSNQLQRLPPLSCVILVILKYTYCVITERLYEHTCHCGNIDTMNGYRRATWLVIALWFLLGVATLNYNGPFYDEAIYVVAGQRTLEGHGYSDGYLVWFGGSLLWPVLSAIGFRVAGLIGTRFMALLAGTISLAAMARASAHLFDEQVGFWSALTFAVSGPFIALARLGVYDGPALAGLATSLWAITRLARTDNRVWLGVAALAFTIGMFSKYPLGIMLLPILGVLLVYHGRKAPVDVGIFGFISLILTLALFLPAREQLSQIFVWQFANKPRFGVTVQMIGFLILYLTALPALLALGGWIAARGRRRLGAVLWLSLLVWPAYHTITRSPISVSKHMVAGLLFAYPLVGMGLSQLWRSWAGRLAVLAIVFSLAVLGGVQAYQLDHAWPDLREASDYLVSHVQPGERLLINESWQFTMYLYLRGRIDSPWDVYDDYRISHGQSPVALCDYDWVVDVKGSYTWPQDIQQQLDRCTNLEQVFSATSRVINQGTDLRYINYSVETVIWRNRSLSATR